MTLCEKCIHGEICADRDCLDADDERALDSCNNFKDKNDVVKVVRCGKCEYWHQFKANPDMGECNCNENGLFEFTKPVDFCSYGTPKEREGEK